MVDEQGQDRALRYLKFVGGIGPCLCRIIACEHGIHGLEGAEEFCCKGTLHLLAPGIGASGRIEPTCRRGNDAVRQQSRQFEAP